MNKTFSFNNSYLLLLLVPIFYSGNLAAYDSSSFISGREQEQAHHSHGNTYKHHPNSSQAHPNGKYSQGNKNAVKVNNVQGSQGSGAPVIVAPQESVVYPDSAPSQ